MYIDPDIAESRTAVLLASALHLLTCSAANGMTRAKSESLILHLTEVADRKDTDPLLARACDELAEVWRNFSSRFERASNAPATVQTEQRHLH